MQDRVFIKAPAKINLFLRILNQRKNKYHNIRTGITFLDLHDEIIISLNNKNNLSYSGPFKPAFKIFENDIIAKVLKDTSLRIQKKISIEIVKNIPSFAGLGSASTDAASLIKGLQKYGLIKDVNNSFLSKIGSDVPACFYGKNCLVTGTGNIVNTDIHFPKYYFVLVKPNIQLSTTNMYNKIKDYQILDKNYIAQTSNLKKLHENDFGNDFEKIVRDENKEIADLLDFLSNLDKIVFSRMTGSGSCCYAVFDNKEYAEKAFRITVNKFGNYWIHLSENNIF